MTVPTMVVVAVPHSSVVGGIHWPSVVVSSDVVAEGVITDIWGSV